MEEVYLGLTPAARDWLDLHNSKIRASLISEGKFIPIEQSVIPALAYPEQAFEPWERSFESSFHPDQRSPQDKIFRDMPLERSRWLPASHPSFMHEGAAANLTRRTPNELRESIARDLVESDSLEHFNTKFRIAAFLISRGVTENGGPEIGQAIFPEVHFSEKDFKSYQPKVDRLISSAQRHFFTKNKFVKKDAGVTAWQRFHEAWKKLSRKQKSAVKIYYMGEEKISFEAAAKRLKISKASFRDRLQSAEKKIEAAIPEFKGLHIVVPPIKKEKKDKPKIFYPAKNAPSKAKLNAWLEETCHEPKWPEWSVVFQPPRLPKEIKEL